MFVTDSGGLASVANCSSGAAGRNRESGGALHDPYEAADEVLIEELETHPHFGRTALHWLGEETEADPEFGSFLDAEPVRARVKR
jgi:hypothetical protein